MEAGRNLGGVSCDSRLWEPCNSVPFCSTGAHGHESADRLNLICILQNQIHTLLWYFRKKKSTHLELKLWLFPSFYSFREADVSQILMRLIVLCKMSIKCWSWYSFCSYPLRSSAGLLWAQCWIWNCWRCPHLPFLLQGNFSPHFAFLFFFLKFLIHFTQFGQRSSQEKAVSYYMLVKPGPQPTCCLSELSK